MKWQVGSRTLSVAQGGILMGIVNVTPDSFSDGGKFFDTQRAVRHAKRLLRQGAVILDIGGESTRPGSHEVDEATEIARILPVVQELRRDTHAIISVDTRHTAVAAAALQAGADIINDIGGLTAPGMAELCAQYGCGVVVMHMQGTPETMQDAPHYTDVIGEVRAYFDERYQTLRTAGIKPEQICWDPGIGFGKTLEHNLTLLANLRQLQVAGRPVLLGLSRKRMLSAILHSSAQGRAPLGTAVMTVWGHLHGAHIHRVHDVAACSRALRLVTAVQEFER